ncbi:ribonuclease H1-like [Leptopilina boulardi]|uniref:ribonuclease H1-like n=1 Tax=Leptopilina boulardi TaxID=63433 RepID=UPI0021F55A6C|nr:ribonuclease H1-like [Leptopilina boulardi]
MEVQGQESTIFENCKLLYDKDGYLQVFTDGACSFNGTERAWTGVGVYFNELHPCNISMPVEGNQTCNAAELRSALLGAQQALKMGAKKLTINTDSKPLINSFQQWIPTWIDRGWVNTRGKPIKNKEDLIHLHKLLGCFESVKWNYVPSHGGTPGNESADKLAKDGIQRISEEQHLASGSEVAYNDGKVNTSLITHGRYNLRPRKK